MSHHAALLVEQQGARGKVSRGPEGVVGKGVAWGGAWRGAWGVTWGAATMRGTWVGVRVGSARDGAWDMDGGLRGVVHGV